MPSDELVVLIVLVTLICALTAVIVMPWLIKARERVRVHETLRYLVDKGQVPPSELLAGLAEPPRPKPLGHQDLRRGIFWLSLAAGIAGLVASIVVSSDDMNWVVAPGLAAFPCAIGIGYVFLWLLNRTKEA
jgi:hypothetical protein